jgi:glycosyltransferase 2 family protein
MEQVNSHPPLESTPPSNGAGRRRLGRAVRIVVSCGLLAVLVFAMDWPTMVAHARSLSPAIATFVILAFAVQLAVSAWKWQWSLRIHGLRFPYVYLTRVLVIGFFLNNFLPTSIGGDAYRVYKTVPSTPPRSRAISAVLLERLVGLSALLLLGLVGALILYANSELARAYALLAAGSAVAGLATLGLLRARSAKWRDSSLLRSKWIGPAVENVRTIARARSEWLPLLGISLLFQAQAILIVYELFHAVDPQVDLAHAALITATAGIAAIVPFSINGLGIVEATIAGTAIAVGLSYEAGLLVALLMRLLLIPLTLLAALFYAFEPAPVREASTSLTA